MTITENDIKEYCFINLDFLKEVNKASYELFAKKDCTKYVELQKLYTPCFVYVAEKLNKNRRARTKRVKDKITDMILSGNGIFLTFTFTDEVLENTNQQTRRKYIERFLKQFCNNYVANIDFGSKNGREHYHAIVNCQVDYKKWLYGAVNGIRIRNQDKDIIRTSKYINKLTWHAFKASTRNGKFITPRLIYSR